MKRAFAAGAVLVAVAAVGAPAPIDVVALKAAFDQDKAKVVSLERHLGPPKIPDGSFARACQNWKLTEAQALSFFTRATAISPDEMRSTYSVLPCQYSGSISIDGTPYQFSINVGRFGFIRGASPESTALFGCRDVCKDLFRIDIDVDS
jgi:hypothetical protein